MTPTDLIYFFNKLTNTIGLKKRTETSLQIILNLAMLSKILLSTKSLQQIRLQSKNGINIKFVIKITFVRSRLFGNQSNKGKNEAFQYLESWMGRTNQSSSSQSKSTIANVYEDVNARDENNSISKQSFAKSKTNITKSNSNSPSLISSPHSLSSNFNSNKPLSPLVITGSSYLFPTLRIERTDTAKSLANQIDLSLSTSNSNPHSSFSTMLVGKSIVASTSKSQPKRWKVPLILDLGAFHPDGSPHYIQPTEDLLRDIVEVLHQRGIQVVGITNAPMMTSTPTVNTKNETNTYKEIKKNIEEVVSSLGLPPVMPVRNPHAINKMSMTIEDVIKLISVKEKDALALNDSATNKNINEEEFENGNEECKNLQTKINNDKCVIGQEPLSTTNESTTFHSCENEEQRGIQLDHKSNSTAVEIGKKDNQTTMASKQIIFPTDPPSTTRTTAKIYHGNVRTGQQISAENGRSLIIIGSVHSGGEVMADSDIYVYGKLKGRALAGLNGDDNAKIIASQFDPELICIGNIYTTIDDVTELGLQKRDCPVLVEVDLKAHFLTFQQISL